MPRERDYGQEYERRQQHAFNLGYESDYQRRQILRASGPEQLYRHLQPLAAQRKAEGDWQSLGLIFKDIYDLGESGWDIGDLWEDMEY